MRMFPMFFRTDDRRVVVFGEGERAAQKVRLLLKTNAEIVLVADDPEPELQALIAKGRIVLHRGRMTRSVFRSAILAFVATGCPGADSACAAVARREGVPVNVVDSPEMCDVFTPSIVDRDPVVVAIGTEGSAPLLARVIKTQIEALLEPRLGELAALAGRLRDMAAARLSAAKRRALWRWVFTDEPRRLHAMGSEREAVRMVKDAIAGGVVPDETHGSVSLVGAGPGARDLITMRGVQRLQDADIIFYDRLVDPGLLELARRDAERVYVGKRPGHPTWPQDRINNVLVAAARQGKCVVRLKCGDPGIFARGAEEAAALTAAGIPWEIVPGVTAASGAAAAAGGFLTERGSTDTVVITTGHVRPGDPLPDWNGFLNRGVTLALYMAVNSAGHVRRTLLDGGQDGETSVEIISKAGSPDQVVVRTTLAALDDAMADHRLENPAMILIRRPKSPASVIAFPGSGTSTADTCLQVAV